MIDRITNHPLFIALAVLGIIDMTVQAATSGRIKLIQSFLRIVFG